MDCCAPFILENERFLTYSGDLERSRLQLKIHSGGLHNFLMLFVTYELSM